MKLTLARTQGLGLVALSLAVYYPVLASPLNPLDDRAIVDWLYNLQGFPLREIFTRATDYYYRPVLWLTYLWDFYLWGAEASFMHLENMLLHTANVLLIFNCSRIIFTDSDADRRWLSFWTALLFAIHPVNTEAVNWIAARSDLLAGFFVLLSACLLFAALSQRRPLLAWFSLLALLPGCLAKETALFFLPAALFIIYCDNKPASAANPERSGWREKSWYGMPYLVLPLVYLVLRGPAFLRQDAGIKLFQQFREYDLLPSLSGVLGGIGFYAKKLFWPWPLNLTIDHVPPGYLWLGLLVLSGLCCAVWRRGKVSGLLLACFCVGMSAILALLLRPAWTPVAERYLYVPSAFFCLATVPAGYRLIERLPLRRGLSMALIAGLVIATWTTISRNILWQDNIRLFEDAVSKSPDFPFAKSTLAALLLEAGRKEEGAAIIRANIAPETLRNADFLDLQRAQLLYQEGRLGEARTLILEKRRRDRQLYLSFQELLSRVDAGLFHASAGLQRESIFNELVEVYLELYRGYREPFYLYLLAQLYMKVDDREKASRYFRQAGMEASASAHYKATANKLAERLSQQ